MRTVLLAAAAALALAPPPAAPARAESAVSLPAELPAGLFKGPRSRDVLAAQILLDRARHSPGAIDGISGGNTARAVRAYRRAHGLDAAGKVDASLLSHLRERHAGDLLQHHRLTEEDVGGPFVAVPSGFAAQAGLDSLAFERVTEKLAEKFHMSEAFLKALNPGSDFAAGGEILVVAPRTGTLSAEVKRVEVDKSASAVRAYAADGSLVATYPATVGSSTFPSPNGSLTVKAVAPNPTYHFDPEGRDWGPNRSVTIAAGPNNPVGSTWIDLSRDGYGLHGTPDPTLIGKTASHGCVRLTNWDAAELASAVSQGTKVEFVG